MTGAAALALAAATGAACFAFTWLAVRVLSARAILDAPNARSSHTRPTPRGGGLAVVAALLPAVAVIAAAEGEFARFLPLLAAALLLAFVSFADDVRGLGAGLRLMAQTAAVLLGLAALPDAPVSQGLLPFWLDRAIVAVAWLWFVNLFNFMDGIDGIAAVETIAVAAGVALIAWLAEVPGALLPLGLATAAAAAGFLPWNWHRARIFLGDVGSVPLGYLIGFLLLTLAARGFWAAALVLPLYYLIDATWTLLARLLRGERVWEAHREHWYQHAAAATRHDAVSLRIAAGNAALVSVAVASALVGSGWGAVAVVVVFALVLELRRMASRGRRP